MLRMRLALIAPVLAVAACSGSTGEGTAGSPPAPNPSQGSPKPPSSSAASPAPVATPKGWRSYSHPNIGLSFWFPPLPGAIAQGPDGSSNGPRFRWTIKRSDRCDPRGTCRTYEFAAVNDGCPATPAFPTFAHRWTESGGKHTVSRCEGVDPIAIQPLRVVSRPDGLRGVIYDANVWFPKGSSIPGAIAAVLNLPKGFHPNYEALALYFEDPTSLDAIEHALKLVRLG